MKLKCFVGAEIHMKPEQDGGRHCKFSAGWCPHLSVSNIGLSHNIAVRVTEVIVANQSGMMFPGEDGELIFTLCPTSSVAENPPLGFNELTEGDIFEILEGPRVRGTGKILLKWMEP